MIHLASDRSGHREKRVDNLVVGQVLGSAAREHLGGEARQPGFVVGIASRARGEHQAQRDDGRITGQRDDSHLSVACLNHRAETKKRRQE